ncbi:hypothetical protein BWGOE4_13860 [Bacillus mycoides]|uniref:Uncharacterized protein n=1 Tax=Bacillus mycoides TaxID=1405 RepID=A0A1E8BQZ4_BACMY|nr:hypothetical protein IEM_03619 [Bacillus cereus BAG6O-2]OFD44443.1 hypothetical protein BWGOE2_17040 [Bacillus mycoides]OFD47277.1 hypothetical protein BWGOE1_17570 [Bacillus mycoides]OFD50256.1 hypothetical protein BWGOE3_17150 [Bacillus mycoides]OFD62685.1 hypothetical protein BWGOE6_17480 [Bacillus mycoides]
MKNSKESYNEIILLCKQRALIRKRPFLLMIQDFLFVPLNIDKNKKGR